jgi:hypothetical protein
MTCAIEMGSDAYIYMTSFINIGSAIQRLIRGIFIQTHIQSAR